MLHTWLFRLDTQKVVDSPHLLINYYSRIPLKGGFMEHILTRPVSGQVIKSFVSRPETPSQEDIAQSLGISRQWLHRWYGDTVDLPKIRQQAEVLRFMYHYPEFAPPWNAVIMSGENFAKQREEIGWSNFELRTLLGISERQLLNWKKMESVGTRLDRMVRVLTYIVLYEYERVSPVRRQKKENVNGVSRETA